MPISGYEKDKRSNPVLVQVCNGRLAETPLTVGHHLHSHHASGAWGPSGGHGGAHVVDHASWCDCLAHHRPHTASHGALWTPALLHGAPHGPIPQHV